MTALLPLTLTGAATARGGKMLAGPVDLVLDGPGASVIIGPNGAGKTSLLRMMHGAARISKGSITWGCDTDEARHHQAFVFQRPIMLRRSVLQNILYPLRVRKVARAESTARARNWAERVGLGEKLDLPATVLSGGEQQKLALARALVIDPKVLFLDEPCAALDGRATREIEAILQDAKAAGTKIVMTTHDLGQARRIADEVIFLLRGRVHERQPTAAFFDAPETPQARAFLNGDIVE